MSRSPRFAGQLRLLDNIDPNFVNDTLAQIDLKKTLFLLISKSGETVEIISLAEILFQKQNHPEILYL